MRSTLQYPVELESTVTNDEWYIVLRKHTIYSSILNGMQNLYAVRTNLSQEK